MGRHKTTNLSDEERSELYLKYVEPNHSLVRTTVARLTQKKNEVDDNFQEICKILLRNVDTYNPSMKLSTWIITCCRRELGKIEAAKPSYVDAKKGGDFEYVTEHHGYKKKYRPKKTKNFVNNYSEDTFVTHPDDMVHDGVNEEMINILNKISPESDFGTGTYAEIESAIISSNDKDLIIRFRKYFYNEKVRDIAQLFKMSEKSVRQALGRMKTRLKTVSNDKR